MSSAGSPMHRWRRERLTKPCGGLVATQNHNPSLEKRTPTNMALVCCNY